MAQHRVLQEGAGNLNQQIAKIAAPNQQARDLRRILQHQRHGGNHVLQICLLVGLNQRRFVDDQIGCHGVRQVQHIVDDQLRHRQLTADDERQEGDYRRAQQRYRQRNQAVNATIIAQQVLDFARVAPVQRCVQAVHQHVAHAQLRQ